MVRHEYSALRRGGGGGDDDDDATPTLPSCDCFRCCCWHPRLTPRVRPLVWLVARPWLCATLAFAASLLPAFTMGVCYALARRDGQLDDDGGSSLPTITATGDQYPARGLFIFGFVVTAALIALVTLARGAALEQRYPTRVCPWLNTPIALLGTLAAPAIVVMAAVRDSELHLTAAFVGLGLLVVWTVAHTLQCCFVFAPRIARCRGVQPPALCVLLLAYAVLTLAAPVMLAQWRATDGAAYEWAGVLALVFYMLPVAGEFVWMQLGRGERAHAEVALDADAAVALALDRHADGGLGDPESKAALVAHGDAAGDGDVQRPPSYGATLGGAYAST